MDFDDAVDVAITAAESVLRFHVVALSKSHQPFIDIKFFKSAIQKAIKRKAKRKIKDHIDDNVAHMALTHITRLAGDAAFGAATEWNARSDPTNHVHREWLRSCVRNLVSGSVHSLDHTHPLDTRETLEYLDPSGEALMLESYHDARSRRAPETPSANHHDNYSHHYYYGFEPTRHPAAVHLYVDDQDGHQQLASCATQNAHRGQDYAPPFSSVMKSGWTAINQYAADPFSPTAGAKCQETLRKLGLVSPKSTDCDGDDGNKGEEEEEMDLEEQEEEEGEEYEDTGEDDEEEREKEEPKEKNHSHRRNVTRKRTHIQHALRSSAVARPTTTPSSRRTSGPAALLPRSGNARKPKLMWTKQEEITLISARQAGKSWSDIHDILSHRTASACEKKYRDLNLSSHYCSQAQHSAAGTTTAAQQEDEDHTLVADESEEQDEMDEDDEDMDSR